MPLDSPATPPLASIRTSRQKYIDTMLATMRAPDGSYEDSFVLPGSNISPQRTDRKAADLEKNNPLSLDDEVWAGWYSCSPPSTLNTARRTPGKSGSPLSNSERPFSRMLNEREHALTLRLALRLAQCAGFLILATFGIPTYNTNSQTFYISTLCLYPILDIDRECTSCLPRSITLWITTRFHRMSIPRSLK